VRKAKTPLWSKRMGNNKKYQLRQDWEQAKEGVMKVALKAKFI